MPTSLTRLTTPALPVTLATLKAHLRVSTSVEDALLTTYLTAASDRYTAETGYVGTAADWLYDLDFPTDRIVHLPRWPVDNVFSVATDVGAVAGYTADETRRTVTLPDAATGTTVAVIFTAGDTTADADAQVAVLHAAAHLYAHRGGGEREVPMPSWWGRMVTAKRGAYALREQQ